MGNPYAAPTGNVTTPTPVHLQRARLSRGEVAGKFAITGFIGGGLLGTFGYLALIVVIELLLTPPFKSPPNYGQFLIVIFGVGFYMSIFGLCLGLVPYITSIGYIPLHVLGVLSILAVDQQFFAEVDWTEAPIAAMVLLLASPTVIAIAFDFRARRMQTPAQLDPIVDEQSDDRERRRDSLPRC